MLNRNERKWRSQFIAAAATAVTLSIPLSVSAQIPVFGVDAVNIALPIPRTVQELLELDAQRALDEEKRKAHSANGGGA